MTTRPRRAARQRGQSGELGDRIIARESPEKAVDQPDRAEPEEGPRPGRDRADHGPDPAARGPIQTEEVARDHQVAEDSHRHQQLDRGMQADSGRDGEPAEPRDPEGHGEEELRQHGGGGQDAEERGGVDADPVAVDSLVMKESLAQHAAREPGPRELGQPGGEVNRGDKEPQPMLTHPREPPLGPRQQRRRPQKHEERVLVIGIGEAIAEKSVSVDREHQERRRPPGDPRHQQKKRRKRPPFAARS